MLDELARTLAYFLAVVAALFLTVYLLRRGTAKAGRDKQSPRVLVRLSSDMQAKLLADALVNEGISARLVGDFTSGFRAEAPGEVRILVPNGELEQAKAALARIQQDGDEM